MLLTDFKSSFKNTSIKQWKYQKKVRFQVAKIFSFRLLDYKHRWQVTHWQKKQMILSAVSLKSLLQKSTKPEARRPNPTKDEKDQHHSTCSCLALHLQPSSFSTSPSNTTHTAHRRNWKDNTTQCYRLYHSARITKKFVMVSIVTMYHINPCVMRSLFTTFKAEKLHCTLQTEPLFSKRYSFA